MAFPTPIPAENTVHREDGARFVVHNGKWERRNDERIFTLHNSLVANRKTVNIHPDKDTQRVDYQAAFQMTGGSSNVQLNVSRNGTWLDGGSGSYSRVAGSLTDGPNRWRKGANEWKGLRAFDNDGFYVNWVESGWEPGVNNRGYLLFNVQNLEDSWSIFTWKLLFQRSSDYPGMVLGSGWLHAATAEIDRIRITAKEQYFGATCIIAKSY
jgi:hypothetical protein